MIIQPLVENAIKHGILPKEAPGHLKVTFSGSDDTLECIIEDDGIGFDMEKKKATVGHGLNNMRVRAERLGGNLEVKSAVGEGTFIKLTLPV